MSLHVHASRSFVGLGLFVFLVVSGCQKIGYFLDVPSTPYHRELDRHTRQASYYSLAETKYLSHVTYKSTAWRKAYVQEYAERFELTEMERQELLTVELDEAQEYDVFLFSLYTGDRKADDLSTNSSTWKVWLEGGDQNQRVYAKSIAKLSDRDSRLRYFYPYITPGWSNVYLLKFPRQAEASKVELRASGVVANLNFVWENPE